MDISIIIAVVAASISIIGWIVNHILSGYRDRKKQILEASLRYIETQLKELYGPLAFLVMEGQRTFKDFLDSMGKEPDNSSTRHIFSREKQLSEEELKNWLFWVENDFFPRDEKIKNLLMGKTHLIEGSKIPRSFILFLDHYNSWRINHLRWKKEGIKYSWHSKINYPIEFELDILSIFEKLKQQHHKILNKISKI